MKAGIANESNNGENAKCQHRTISNGIGFPKADFDYVKLTVWAIRFLKLKANYRERCVSFHASKSGRSVHCV